MCAHLHVVTVGPEAVAINSHNHLLVCIAIGNPTPTVTWTQLGGAAVETDGAEFNVCDSSLVKRWRTNSTMDAQSAALEMQTLQCTAKSGNQSVTKKYSLLLTYIWLMCGKYIIVDVVDTL